MPLRFNGCPSQFCLGDGRFRCVILPPPGMLGRLLVFHYWVGRFAGRPCCERCRGYTWRLRRRVAFRLSWLPTHSLALNVRHTLLPRLRPTVITHRISQCQERIDTQPTPMHTSPFEPRFHDHFVGTLDHATTNWPTRRLKGWIVHLCHTLLQIGQIL